MRKIQAIVFALLFSHDWVFLCMGWINRRVRLFDSMFVMYPAASRYARAYAHPWVSRQYEWKPTWIGFGRQAGGGKIMMMCLTNPEDDLIDPKHAQQLAQTLQRLEKIQQMLGIAHCHLAGILPSVLAQRGLRSVSPEADVTADVVMKAVHQVEQCERLSSATPLIILGGAGFIGRRLVTQYRQHGRAVYVVDPQGQADDVWPEQLRGQAAILLNVTRKSVIDHYIVNMWSGLVLINEVYPAPDAGVIARLAAQGIQSYHVVGVKGWSFPPFPANYVGAIPCCAARWFAHSEVVVRPLHSPSDPAQWSVLDARTT